MNKLKAATAAGLMAGWALVTFAQDTLSPREVQQRSVEATRVDGTEATSTLVIMNRLGEKRLRKMTIVSKIYDKGKLEKKMVRFLEPADVKGTGFLSFDYDDKNDDKWIYMPALRKTRRIVSSENAKSFMGSEFSYADMSLPTIEDFLYAFLPDETVNGELCFTVEITPKSREIARENGFAKKISHIGKKDFVLRKSVYFNSAGEREKILEVKSIVEVDKEKHKFKMREIEISNMLNQRKSISILNEIRYNPSVPDEYFTTRFLEK